MFKRIIWCLIIMAVIFSMVLCACGKSDTKAAADVPEESAETIKELGDAFSKDLQRTILPNKENPQSLPDYGYVLAVNNSTYGANELTEFFDAYQGKNDGELTIIFASSSFVVSRVVYLDGNLYYLRYEYDKFNPDDIAISCQLVDGIDLKRYSNDTSTKLVLTMSAGKKDITFELKNPSKSID